jgi:hypothetical protein
MREFAAERPNGYPDIPDRRSYAELSTKCSTRQWFDEPALPVVLLNLLGSFA